MALEGAGPRPYVLLDQRLRRIWAIAIELPFPAVSTGGNDLAQVYELLLYRITSNFAAPPCTQNDAYKCAWSFTLLNSDDPTCRLEISDHKGRPEAHFRGGEKASTEALQLFDWLTGTNCPHPYDYTLCGRHA
jgi:hypothetical protein